MLDECRQYALVLPAPNPNEAYVPKNINDLNFFGKHVHTFNKADYDDKSDFAI